METIKVLRGISLRKILPVVILLIAAGIGILVFSQSYRVVGSLAPRTLAELTPETAEGAFVEDDVKWVYDYYAEEIEYTNNIRQGVSGRQYIIDLDDYYYIGLFAHEKHLDEVNRLMNACNRVYEILDDDMTEDEMMAAFEEMEFPAVHVRGTVRAMEGEVLEYYMKFANGDRELEEAFLPYYIDMDHVGDEGVFVTWLIFAGTLALVLAGVALLVYTLTGGYQKKLLKSLGSMGDQETMLEKLDQFYRGTEPFLKCQARIGTEFIMLQQGARPLLFRSRDLAWAYQETTQHRTNGIPSGKTYAAVLRMMDGTRHDVGMRADEVQSLLDRLHQSVPAVVVGYSKELEEVYWNNRQAFAQRWEDVPAGTAGQDQDRNT